MKRITAKELYEKYKDETKEYYWLTSGRFTHGVLEKLEAKELEEKNARERKRNKKRK